MATLTQHLTVTYLPYWHLTVTSSIVRMSNVVFIAFYCFIHSFTKYFFLFCDFAKRVALRCICILFINSYEIFYLSSCRLLPSSCCNTLLKLHVSVCSSNKQTMASTASGSVESFDEFYTEVSHCETVLLAYFSVQFCASTLARLVEWAYQREW